MVHEPGREIEDGHQRRAPHRRARGHDLRVPDQDDERDNAAGRP